MTRLRRLVPCLIGLQNARSKNGLFLQTHLGVPSSTRIDHRDQAGRRALQGTGQLHDDVQGRRLDPPFKLADVGAMHTSPKRQLLLREPQALAEFGDLLPKELFGTPRCVSVRHGGMLPR